MWFWVFPSQKLSADPISGSVMRYHIYPTSLQNKEAVRRSGIPKNATVHTLYSFATHLVEKGYDIRTVHSDTLTLRQQ